MRADTKRKHEMGRRFATVIGVAAAGVMALGAQTTAAAPDVDKYDTKLTITNEPPWWHGRVKSSKHACEVQRQVKLFEVRSGPKPNKLLGKDRSNRRGNWKLVRPLEPGRFYAKVVPSDDGTAGTSFVCRGDRTETIDTH